MNDKKYSISAFFPCYNDKGTIGKLVEGITEELRKLTDNFEVIVIDDGSTDGSRDLLRKLQKKYDFLKVVFHKQNQGYGGALQSGFRTASKDLIFYTDGDAQYDVKELSLLYEKMTENIDFVNGFKIKRHDPWYRIVIGKIYHWIMKLMFGFKIRDVDCDFRLIRRSVFDKIDLRRKTGVICVEMITKFHQAKLRFVEVGVNHYDRTYGCSQFFNFSRLLRTFIDLFKLWWEIILLHSIKERSLKGINYDKKIEVKNSGVIRLQFYNDFSDGNLVIGESEKSVPFEIKRIYYINNLFNSDAIRGEHAHKKLKQIIFCINGSFILSLDDGINKQKITMDNPYYGIKLYTKLWHTMTNFSKDCVILVLANDYYKEDDYIRDYDKFLEYINKK